LEACTFSVVWCSVVLVPFLSPGARTCLDLDPVEFGGELVVDGEHVAVLDLLGLGLLGEDPLGRLPTGQRLQRSHQLPLGDVRLLLDLLQGPRVTFGIKVNKYIYIYI